MNDEFISLVGSADARLRRIRARSTKSEIHRLIMSGNYAPEQQLRAYLAIGRNPPAELLSENIISNALRITDRIAFLPLLSRKCSTVYADEVLDSIQAYLDKFRSARTEGIVTGLDRVVAKWSIAKGKLNIAPSTCIRFIKIVAALAKRSLPGLHHRSAGASRNEKALKSLTRFAILWGQLFRRSRNHSAYSKHRGLERRASRIGSLN